MTQEAPKVARPAAEAVPEKLEVSAPEISERLEKLTSEAKVVAETESTEQKKAEEAAARLEEANEKLNDILGHRK